jgi:hypothetical protein
MTIEHITFGDGVSGSRLIGFATDIKPVSANNPFNTKKQLKLKKTRGRNSICYIDQLLKVNNIEPRTIVEKIKYFCKSSNKISIPTNFQIYSAPEHLIIGELLIAFCDDFGRIEKDSKSHGHNMQRVKDISGSPAICYIDEPCYVNKNEKYILK